MAAPCLSLSSSKLLLIFVVFCFLICPLSSNFFDKEPQQCLTTLDEFPVDNSNTIVVKAHRDGTQRLCIFCYPGQAKRWYRLWTNPRLTLDTNGQDVQYKVFYGNNATEVEENSQSSLYLPWPSLPFVSSRFTFYPFNNSSCIGFTSDKNYTLNFTVKNPELLYVWLTVVGLFLFFYAGIWSRNVVLHYSVGISVGVFGSFLILVFVGMKFVPQKLKTLAYVIGAVSTSISLYLYQYVSSCLNEILLNNWKIVFCYFLVFGIISFAAVYRYGPVTNPRSLDLVKWTLQAFGLVLVYNGTQIPEMSVAIVLMVLATYNIPHRLLPTLTQFRFRYFPPKKRLLTEEEYLLEGDLETKKALEHLRQFCRSPDCDTWKTVSRLTSPSRFASFIEGDSHILDAEFENHINESAEMRFDLMAEVSSEEDSDSDSAVMLYENSLVKN